MAAKTTAANQQEKRHRSVFDVPPNCFDSCRLLQSPHSISNPPLENPIVESQVQTLDEFDDDGQTISNNLMQKWTCNTCKAEFDSLQDQRSHFKSDIHRFNIKLSIAGKDTVKEEDFDETTSDSLFNDYDISSISGSEDEDDHVSGICNEMNVGLVEGNKKKIFVHLQTGDTVSIWKCLLMDESKNISFEKDKSVIMDDGDVSCQTEREVIEKLNHLIQEPRDNTCLRIVLLARGGHFAGCVFDGNSVVAHKTFHRYVIRARAGKKQSSKDGSGKIAHSAGASVRRYNELALKKEIQELFAAWRPYFDASSCVFIHAPSSNRQLLFDGEKPFFSCQKNSVRHVPFTVRRPTFKEAKRLYNLLTQVSSEADEEIIPIIKQESIVDRPELRKEDLRDISDIPESTVDFSGAKKLENLSISSEGESEHILTTPLHDAARSNNAEKILELLEQGLDPCVKDERGRTPYMLATEKEVRNTFRRFMASNLDKWDWNAAKVPSALTKEMEESQNAKQAEKDAKKKSRAKELKKLRKAREKKAQAEAEAEAEAAQRENVASVSGNRGASSNPVLKGQSRLNGAPPMSKEEELRKAQVEEREKRAAAAERRLAAAAALKASSTDVAPINLSPNNALSTDMKCSCCNASLAGKVPFHRYNYKYCSTSCMHAHREIIEDD